VKLLTLPSFLLGRREAILDVAHGRKTILLGFLFVVSAGLARTWDTVDLLANPFAVLRPIGASLATSTVFFLIIATAVAIGCRASPELRPNWVALWRSILAVFWMTAPLAWIYAVPVERFTSVATSVDLNFNALFLVALWRVVLMIRAVTVLLDVRVAPITFLTLWFGDIVVFAAMALTPVPVFNAMAGINVEDPESIMAAQKFATQALALVALLPLTILALGMFLVVRPASPWSFRPRPAPARSLWILAIIAIVGWVPGMAVTQPELRRATAVDRAVERSSPKDAVALLKGVQTSDLPPHWRPRMHSKSREGWDGYLGRIATIQSVMLDPATPTWVRDRIDGAIDSELRNSFVPFGTWEHVIKTDDHLVPTAFLERFDEVLDTYMQSSRHVDAAERAAWDGRTPRDGGESR
jgi:hypothetical protein